MTMKSFVFSLVLAVACLVVANVQADIVSGVPTGIGKTFELTVSADVLHAVAPSATKAVDYAQSSFTYNIDPTTPTLALYTLTITPPNGADISHFVMTNNNPNAGLYGFGVVGETTGEQFQGGLWDTFAWEVMDQNQADGLQIQFQASMYPTNFTISFYGTEVMDGPGDNTSPEPATLAVLGLGLAGLGAVTRRRRK